MSINPLKEARGLVRRFAASMDTPAASFTDYEDKRRKEIDIYANMDVIHDLPDIFHYWSNKYVLPGLIEVFDVRSIADFYALAVRESAPSGGARVLSVGCGFGSEEIGIAQALLDSAYGPFEIICADISPPLIARFKNCIPPRLTPYLTPVVCDINSIDISEKFDCIIANQSLHHIENLEGLFDYVATSLTDRGVFATADMIGRNGHLRWPEAESIIQSIWQILPDRQRVNRQMQRIEHSFTDHDCSTEGFEGIRAQDVLPLILQRLNPRKFLGFSGGVVAPFIDRAFGHNFDINDIHDTAFIDMAAQLDELLLDADVLKPTQMFAYFSKDQAGEIFYRARSARQSVRPTGVVKSWTRSVLDVARIPPTPIVRG